MAEAWNVGGNSRRAQCNICPRTIVEADRPGMTVWPLHAPSGDEHNTHAPGCTLLLDSHTLVVK
eukprot:518939-Lingulodinium_polyedra.AAC.1